MDGSESLHSLEDNIDDIEEEDIDEGEEMSPEEAGIQPRFNPPVYDKPYKPYKSVSYLKAPDVLGYLNTFRTIDDSERIRLARACVNYLTAKERQRNGYFLKRQEMLADRKSRGATRGHTMVEKSLKRTRSMRAIDDVPPTLQADE